MDAMQQGFLTIGDRIPAGYPGIPMHIRTSTRHHRKCFSIFDSEGGAAKGAKPSSVTDAQNKATSQDVETRQRRMRIVVASKAALKVAAVKKAFSAVLKCEIDVQGESCPSRINEQPYGHEETLLGARNRLKGALDLIALKSQKVDYVVSVENGIIDTPAGAYDLAWVIVHRTLDGAEGTVPSAGIQFPASAIQSAKERDGGFVKNTVGSIIASSAEGDRDSKQGASKRPKTCDPQDPHRFLSGGAVGREELLESAVRIALGSLPQEAPRATPSGTGPGTGARLEAGEGSDEEVQRVLSSTKTIAVVGASANTSAPVFGVMEFLLQKGFKCIPINPREAEAGGEILGQKAVASVREIKERVDVVDIFLRADRVPGAVADAVAQGAGAVWTQLGIEVAAATVAEARGQGLTVITNRCPRVEIPRLQIPTPASK